MEPKSKTELEQEHFQYLEDNLDMIFGTDFFYSPQDGKLINRLLTNYSGLTETTITND